MGEVILGMPGPWAEDFREESDHYTTKIGGLPDWPIRDMNIKPDLLKCGLCKETLCLVAQVSAPISVPKLKIEERVIYVFGCRMSKCGSDPRSWRAIRVQRCHDERQSGSINPEVIPLEENSFPTTTNGNLSEEGFSSFGGHDDESDDDVDLEELGRALSEATSQASQSRNRNFSMHSGGMERVLTSKPRVTYVDASVPVVPCFYIYSQKEKSADDISSVCANYHSISIKGSESPPTDHESEEKWEGETYEYDQALGADRTYLKFKKQMDAYPEQCFRYSYGGNPLLATMDLAKPDICKLCGSSRHYEMQLMPPLLYFLHEAADGSSIYAPEEWSWMTLIIYTCSNNCCSSCEDKSDNCCWTVAEEAVILQDE